MLLCHDDELEGRRIAYILYLVPEEWSAADGGSLDLFDVDAAGHPRDVAGTQCHLLIVLPSYITGT